MFLSGRYKITFIFFIFLKTFPDPSKQKQKEDKVKSFRLRSTPKGLAGLVFAISASVTLRMMMMVSQNTNVYLTEHKTCPTAFMTEIPVPEYHDSNSVNLYRQGRSITMSV